MEVLAIRELREEVSCFKCIKRHHRREQAGGGGGELAFELVGRLSLCRLNTCKLTKRAPPRATAF